MTCRRILGLDWFDAVVHGMFTVAALVGVDAMFTGSMEDVGISLVFAVSLLVFSVRRKRAGMVLPDGEAMGRLAEVEARLLELESLSSRLEELEDRMEFTERVLARQRDPARLAGSGEP